MAITQIESVFTLYEISEEEIVNCFAQLPITFEYILQNKIASMSRQRLDLTVDTTKPMEFIQQEAYLKGSIEEILALQAAIKMAKQEKFATPVAPQVQKDLEEKLRHNPFSPFNSQI